MIEITDTGGYVRLDAWVMAMIIVDCTDNYCDRFITNNPQYRVFNGRDLFFYDPTGRQYDQMTQAARSAPSNIAEGYARCQTSSATELKLLDVGKATLHELRTDYMRILMRFGADAWDPGDPELEALNAVILDHAQYNERQMGQCTRHIRLQKAKFDRWTQADAITAARAMIALCNRCMAMNRNYISYRLEKFKEDGGFSENLSNMRADALKKQSLGAGSPKCPICGAAMVQKVCQKGARAGKRFWSCSNYSTTHCKGTINID